MTTGMRLQTFLLTLPSLGLHLHPAAAAAAAASSSRIPTATCSVDNIVNSTLDSTTTTTATTTVTSTLNNPHRNDPHRTLRVTALIFTGLSALIPITHLYLLHDARYLLAVGVGWYALEGMALILGAVVYLNKTPERWYPHSKVFMLWSSHAFWHVLVLVGMVAHTMGLARAMGVEAGGD
ncbi:hemolysin-III family protein [Aspergillus brunneoviolaceus CBS 621.78]|uniref:Uncharacterized protein n=1 Tax=Aspergillus brunneoviolaceus CBS 621.78 TaxID=1450534 RepID=A0ACD1G0F8_9EURO|nr:hypothetical protein BO95DRAFT_445836 [Aspergillus brunneoviolaceus CBS 621.78]RAH42726.1 hypothetical protein BO95DRAFT_445836 [Aspergillus brunneoviolaceus CBS 621.78]